MPKVYITQENATLNYVSAEEFGEIWFLSSIDYSPIANSLINTQLTESIRKRLVDFNPDEDYIVFSGSPVVSCAIFMILGQSHDRFNMLRWSNRDHRYIPVTVDLSIKENV